MRIAPLAIGEGVGAGVGDAQLYAIEPLEYVMQFPGVVRPREYGNEPATVIGADTVGEGVDCGADVAGHAV